MLKNLLKQRIKENALSYLINMQGSKGKEISYNEIQMKDYLLPFNNLTIPEKKKSVLNYKYNGVYPSKLSNEIKRFQLLLRIKREYESYILMQIF